MCGTLFFAPLLSRIRQKQTAHLTAESHTPNMMPSLPDRSGKCSHNYSFSTNFQLVFWFPTDPSPLTGFPSVTQFQKSHESRLLNSLNTFSIFIECKQFLTIKENPTTRKNNSPIQIKKLTNALSYTSCSHLWARPWKLIIYVQSLDTRMKWGSSVVWCWKQWFVLLYHSLYIKAGTSKTASRNVPFWQLTC